MYVLVHIYDAGRIRFTVIGRPEESKSGNFTNYKTWGEKVKYLRPTRKEGRYKTRARRSIGI